MDNFFQIIGWVIAVLIAIYSGDVRATKLILQHENRKENERNVKLLKGIHEQAVVILPDINEHNATATDRGIPSHHILPILYPVDVFERAFFSGESISIGDETRRIATKYIIKAQNLNCLINPLQSEHFRVRETERTTLNKKKTLEYLHRQITVDMSKIIEKLANQIDCEFKEQMPELQSPKRKTIRSIFKK